MFRTIINNFHKANVAALVESSFKHVKSNSIYLKNGFDCQWCSGNIVEALYKKHPELLKSNYSKYTIAIFVLTYFLDVMSKDEDVRSFFDDPNDVFYGVFFALSELIKTSLEVKLDRAEHEFINDAYLSAKKVMEKELEPFNGIADEFEDHIERKLKSAMIEFEHGEEYSIVMSKLLLPHISTDIVTKGFTDWKDALIVFYCELINNDNYAFKITNTIIKGNEEKSEKARIKVLTVAYATILKYREEGSNPYILSLCEQAYYKVHSSKPAST